MAKALLKSINLWVKLSFAVSLLLLVVSFFLPPLGKIEPSVIQGVAEIGGFVSIITFLYKLPEYLITAKSIKLSKGDASIEVEGKDEN